MNYVTACILNIQSKIHVYISTDSTKSIIKEAIKSYFTVYI